MFELIDNIAVDRKNSLPVADLHARYRSTGTPVVFGDLTRRWLATSQWSIDYISEHISDLQVPLYSNKPGVGEEHLSKPVMHSSLKLYFDELIHRKNDFRVSDLPLSLAPELEKDFSYPRLGFTFDTELSTLGFGCKGAIEPMRKSSNIVNTVHCHFGEPASVLLIPPSQSRFIYQVGRTQSTVSSINFNKPHFGKFPALKNLSGYVAELNHGDALYIPPGFWYCTGYEGVGISLSLKAITGSLMERAGALSSVLLNRVMYSNELSDERLKRLELRTHRQVNARYLKNRAPSTSVD